MAECELVLCEPLCFLINKFGNLNVKILKNVVADFYDVNTIGEAKKRLLDDVGKLSFVNKLPHIAKHRDSADRLMLDFDDIITVLVFLDENGLLDKLPRYVCANPDNFPSVRLFDGDLHILLTRLEKLENKLARLDSSLAAMTGEVRAVRCATVGVSSTSLPAAVQQHGYQLHDRVNTDVLNTDTVTRSAPTLGISVPTVQVDQCVDSGLSDIGNTLNHEVPLSWAARAASTPYVPSGNRKTVISQSESTDDQNDGQHFTEVRSRKKRRLESRESLQLQQGYTDNQNSQVNKRKPLMIGTKTVPTRGITAAKQFVKKEVFYIHNVNESVSVDDMRQFLVGLSVDVLSLFETKSRRSLTSTASSINRKAFRLCINAAHRERLLDGSQWPADVSISAWYFKSGQSHTQPQPRPRYEQQAAAPDGDGDVDAGHGATAGAAAASVDSIDAHSDSEMEQPVDTDATIILCDNSNRHDDMPIQS